MLVRSGHETSLPFSDNHRVESKLNSFDRRPFASFRYSFILRMQHNTSVDYLCPSEIERTYQVPCGTRTDAAAKFSTHQEELWINMTIFCVLVTFIDIDVYVALRRCEAKYCRQLNAAFNVNDVSHNNASVLVKSAFEFGTRSPYRFCDHRSHTNHNQRN
jgi:hypothetical protein